MRYSVKRVLDIDRSEVCCIICKRICIGPRSLKSHYTQTHINNETVIKKKRGRPFGTLAWNKGLTKYTSEIIKRCAENAKGKPGTFIGRKHSEESKRKISAKLSINNKGGRCKWYAINNQLVQGTWELNVGKVLTEHNIEWLKIKTNSYTFKYYMNDKMHSYTPDIFLPQYNLYLEIKGFWWGNDKEKMKCVITQHPNIKIKIIEINEYKKILTGDISFIVE